MYLSIDSKTLNIGRANFSVDFAKKESKKKTYKYYTVYIFQRSISNRYFL